MRTDANHAHFDRCFRKGRVTLMVKAMEAVFHVRSGDRTGYGFGDRRGEWGTHELGNSRRRHANRRTVCHPLQRVAA